MRSYEFARAPLAALALESLEGNPEVAATAKLVSQSFPLGVSNGCVANERMTASAIRK
jgi:hypothetical protein